MKRSRSRPKWQDDYVMDFNDDQDDALFALYTGQSSNDVPITFEDIEQREDKEEWKKAVNEEIQVLEESDTWVSVLKPKEAKLIDTKWVFTRKVVDNKLDPKARLVVRGFQQKENFDDIYSFVLKLQTLRIMLSVAVQRNYHIHQMDVKGAFLHGRIDEEVYLACPKGVKVREGYVLKLKKSLYGLRKSPKYWYEHFTETVTKYGFKRSAYTLKKTCIY